MPRRPLTRDTGKAENAKYPAPSSAAPSREVRVVAWIDSSLQNVQVGRTDYPKPELIRSVGFLVEETDAYVTLARDDMKDDEFRGLVCIPKECIK